MRQPTVCLISLGCAKNLVNSEQMLYLLKEAGFALQSEPEGADAAVLNTCGFIESAKSEAIGEILRLARLKEAGLLKKLVVCGCLPQRYQREILAELPEIDALVGVGSFGEIVSAVRAALGGQHPALFGDKHAPDPESGRLVSTGPGWAYLKIAEGCDNRCAYCVIPDIRGKYRSRPMEKIIAEAEDLCARGVRELIIVAQDTTRYGLDLYGARKLVPLLRELAKIDGAAWIRLHYLYPDELDDALIDLVAAEPKILKYLDIPIQHIDSSILRRMNRRGSGDEIRALFKKLRERIPGLVLRTSLITGLPGEGEAEFDALCAFLRLNKLERAGVFAYSPEEGSPAAEMPDRCDGETAQKRQELVMALQAEIMDAFDRSRVGETYDVLCVGAGAPGGPRVGRSFAESPDVDGVILFSGEASPGELVRVRITEAADGELYGERVEN
ncbi:MAG: 30S ribosomal protein S12 methylthiotransferase RimO [Firmicutes bacterium]|nr:30S ribosomal protein S12 methylthiotransferase RimO [Bacillota bacterium]